MACATTLFSPELGGERLAVHRLLLGLAPVGQRPPDVLGNASVALPDEHRRCGSYAVTTTSRAPWSFASCAGMSAPQARRSSEPSVPTTTLEYVIQTSHTQSAQNLVLVVGQLRAGLEQEAALADELAGTAGLDLVGVAPVVDVDDLVSSSSSSSSAAAIRSLRIVSRSASTSSGSTSSRSSSSPSSSPALAAWRWRRSTLPRPRPRRLDDSSTSSSSTNSSSSTRSTFVEVVLVELGVIELEVSSSLFLLVFGDVVLGVVRHVVLGARGSVPVDRGPGGYTPRSRAPPLSRLRSWVDLRRRWQSNGAGDPPEGGSARPVR